MRCGSTDTGRAHCRRRSTASSEAVASAPDASNGQLLRASSTSSTVAVGAAARNNAITAAAARVVESVQPVSSRNGTPWRASNARTRRTSTRSWAISATGVPCSARSVSSWAVARWASSSKPLHTWHRTRDWGATAWITSSPGGSTSSHKAGTAASSTRRCTNASTPPDCTTIHAEGRHANSASVAAGGAASAHSSAMRARCRSVPPSPPRAPSAARLSARYRSRCDGGTAWHARQMACAVCTTACTA